MFLWTRSPGSRSEAVIRQRFIGNISPLDHFPVRLEAGIDAGEIAPPRFDLETELQGKGPSAQTHARAADPLRANTNAGDEAMPRGS